MAENNDSLSIELDNLDDNIDDLDFTDLEDDLNLKVDEIDTNLLNNDESINKNNDSKQDDEFDFDMPELSDDILNIDDENEKIKEEVNQIDPLADTSGNNQVNQSDFPDDLTPPVMTESFQMTTDPELNKLDNDFKFENESTDNITESRVALKEGPITVYPDTGKIDNSEEPLNLSFDDSELDDFTISDTDLENIELDDLKFDNEISPKIETEQAEKSAEKNGIVDFIEDIELPTDFSETESKDDALTEPIENIAEPENVLNQKEEEKMEKSEEISDEIIEQSPESPLEINELDFEDLNESSSIELTSSDLDDIEILDENLGNIETGADVEDNQMDSTFNEMSNFQADDSQVDDFDNFKVDDEFLKNNFVTKPEENLIETMDSLQNLSEDAKSEIEEIPLDSLDQEQTTDEQINIANDQDLSQENQILKTDEKELSLDGQLDQEGKIEQELSIDDQLSDIDSEETGLDNQLTELTDQDSGLEINPLESEKDTEISAESEINIAESIDDEVEMIDLDNIEQSELSDEDNSGAVGEELLPDKLPPLEEDLELDEISDIAAEGDEIPPLDDTSAVLTENELEEELQDDKIKETEDEVISLNEDELGQIDKDIFTEDNKEKVIEEPVTDMINDELSEDELNFDQIDEKDETELINNENTGLLSGQELEQESASQAVKNTALDEKAGINEPSLPEEDETITLDDAELGNIVSDTESLKNISEPDFNMPDFGEEPPVEKIIDEYEKFDDSSSTEENDTLDLNSLDLELKEPVSLEGENVLDQAASDEDAYESLREEMKEFKQDEEVLSDKPREEPLETVVADLSLESEEAQKTDINENVNTKELQKEVKNVLSYLDQLLDALPNEKIKEFAESEHFNTYQKLFKELGIQ